MGAREDDTELDALAAHARSHPELPAETARELIGRAGAGDTGARDTLVEHSLGVVLDQAVAHRDRGVEVTDLFQEGSVAAMVAVEEYVERGGSGVQLAAYLRRVVAEHLDRVVQREEAVAAESAAMVGDASLLDAAQARLRSRTGREPTAIELAAALDWTPERVDLLLQIVTTARDLFDADILQYLDDEGGGGH
jgi:DNA-directed RNA polymerase sigma subunit (sigma70/sigma32)